MLEKRMNEINARRLELRALLETATPETDLDALTTELEELETEFRTLERAQAALQGMNDGSVPATPSAIENPLVSPPEQRAAETGEKEQRAAFVRYLMSGGEQRSGVTLDNGQAVVPTTLMNDIITEMKENSDVMNFIKILDIKGNLSIGTAEIGSANRDMDGDRINETSVKLDNIQWGSHRVSGIIRIGVGLQENSVPAFEQMLISELALAITLDLEAQVMSGNGSGEAEGLFNIDLPGAQVMTVTAAAFGHTALAAVKGKIRTAYRRKAAYVMNSETFYEKIEGAVGSDKRPLYNENTGLLLKHPVVLSDDAPKNEILFGWGERYWYNFTMSPNITVSAHDGFSEGMVSYRALAFGDGKVVDKRAFAKIEITS